MEKLKKKIFWVIFLILTVFLIIILCIFNYQNYSHEVEEISNNLSRMDEEKNRPDLEEPNQDLPTYIDTVLYTVIFDNDYKIIGVFNYSQNEISDEEIEEIANEILETSNDRKSTKIGNLYFDDYSYSFRGYNSLTIIDNSSSREELISFLKTSIFIFVLAEIIIIGVSTGLTKWIIKPVVESFNKQKQFVADASHELKTPISVIMANAEALENDINEKKWLNNIKSEAERMNSLVTDLLDLARLENDTEKKICNVEDLSKAVETSLLTFESLIYENKIKLEYNIEKDIKYKCNKNEIKQLVAILVDNAIKHSEKNGEIKLNLKKEKDDIYLNVSNKGKEIPKEMQQKIFERFYRADESRNRDDNRYGLGLAIAKNIVISYKGKIWVQSENGVTTFFVKLKSNC